jgi:CubicO group peptidase (beta-lactamase class C family)
VRRPITVEDLLTSRLGLGSIMAPPGAHPIQRAEAALGLQSIGGPPWPPVAYDVDGWIAALGTLPLVAQPGEQWLYNTSLQVLGVVVARAAGRPLGDVMNDRLFAPLGMVDTGFYVPAAQVPRLTSFYTPDPETEEPSVIDRPRDTWWGEPPRWPDSSGWLVSTVDDVWRFTAMLRAGGTLDGNRVLSPASVTAMTSDHLTAEQRAGAGVFLGDHCGWGYGMEVPAAGTSGHALPYGYGWDGGSGTAWRTSSERDVTGILLTQVQMTSPEPPRVYADFWAGVNAATS